MGLLDEPAPLFSPKPRYRAHDNTDGLNAIGEIDDKKQPTDMDLSKLRVWDGTTDICETCQ